MTVKEMIEKLQGMNPEAVVVIDSVEFDPAMIIEEIEQSSDKKYVRVW